MLLTIGNIKGAVGTATAVAGDIKGAVKDPIGTVTNLAGIGDIKGTVTSALNGLDSVLGAIGMGGTMSGTVGAVLNNGMDLSCWGSAYNPETAKTEIQTRFAPAFQTMIDKITQTVDNPEAHRQAINYASEQIYLFGRHNRNISNDGSYASCSRKGWALLAQLGEGIYNNTIMPLIWKYRDLGAIPDYLDIKGPAMIPLPDGRVQQIGNDTSITRCLKIVDITPIYKKKETTPVVATKPKAVGGGKESVISTPSTGVIGTKTVGQTVFDVNGGLLDTVTVVNNTKPKPKQGEGGFKWWYLLPFVGMV